MKFTIYYSTILIIGITAVADRELLNPNDIKQSEQSTTNNDGEEQLETRQNRTIVTDITSHPNWHLINSNNCGTNQQYRIIGGHDAQLGQFPWMVRLGFVRNRADQVMMKCGGAIINSKYIVTAGHCFGGQEKLMFIRVGEHDEYSDPDCDDDQCAPPFIDYEIESILRHAKYDKPRLYANDITVVRIKGEIEFNEFVKPICLEYGDLLLKDYVSEPVQVAGWGIYDLEVDATSRILQHVSMPVISRRQCHNELKSKTVITEKQICAGGIKGKDSCAGDSGGPLMKVESVGGQPPKYFLLGIVSFGTKRCAKTTTPAVYTRVAAYIPWILDHIYP